MQTAKQYFDLLNSEYLAVHREKEDLFWSTYMATSDQTDNFTASEKRWTDFISNASRIGEIKTYLNELSGNNQAESLGVQHGLKGWLALFESNALESEVEQKLKAELINAEAILFEKKKNHLMTFIDENGVKIEASSPALAANLRASDNEKVRASSHQAFLDLEQWVLNNGFIALVKLRNQFARALGYENFFDYSVVKTEHMTTTELFTILDDFEKQTRETNIKSIKKLETDKGADAIKAHNFYFSFAGDATRALDPYMPFSRSLRAWVESFGRLNIDYAGAELTLDLLDRKGKYQNGFCHGPIPSYSDNGKWVPAKVNFTSNALPSQVGSGYSGINTLFHEGGHAAHFSNVTQNAPCFSQEFAPSSMAYAETQSMFCDSLLGDADWLKKYAKDKDGQAVPNKVIKALIETKQPFFAYGERSILVVPYFERALYEMSDEDLIAEKITQLARKTEQKILGLACSPRPLLAIPHLLSDESACSYQGYLLANMAVYQTRAYFIDKFGYLSDNPKIGPLLSKHYWNPGNSISHDDSIRSLTGESFNAKYLADICNLSVDEAWAQEIIKMEHLLQRPGTPMADLNAKIKVVDGKNILADNDVSLSQMCDDFETAIEKIS
ncbi:M3 family metallopeptidase [Candidatus Colwellia aromaticivorans]|uniref:M3 family metallopeptidase n=1 Tax=Candidatus Colwellia aromaticivorans TaxID=2267621 RepID=UPI000DF173FC|nr:M3 family metallopeptidase [Candidatus Colwellia aromaticivorans]